MVGAPYQLVNAGFLNHQQYFQKEYEAVEKFVSENSSVLDLSEFRI